MSARPILFSGSMVRALLEGRKTQTRRVVKPQPPAGLVYVGRVLCSTHRPDEGKWTWAREQSAMLRDPHRVRCPYGQPGDLLWVRETCFEDANEYDYLLSSEHPFYKGAGWIYRASVDDPEIAPPGGWTSAIHMPRRASRLTLRITDVRVQRLIDISDADAIAEGVSPIVGSGGPNFYSHDWTVRGIAARSNFPTAVECYGSLWESINGPGSWDANPWVWAITFGVIARNVDDVLTELANAEVML